MKLRTKATILSGAVALSLFAYSSTITSDAPAPKLTPVVEEAPHYIDRAAIFSALTETAEIVGLAGTAEKTIGYSDAKWYGDKEYELTVKGTFKLGIETEELEVTTSGNTITVRLPQTELLTTDFPFDIADIKKDVGLLRDDLTESELQALYGKAREGAIEDIKRNRQAFERAEASVERTVERIITMVESDVGVKVIFDER